MIVGHKAIAMVARGTAIGMRILTDLQLGGHGWTRSCLILDRKETRWRRITCQGVKVTQSSNSSSSSTIVVVIEVSAMRCSECHSGRIQRTLHLQLRLRLRLRRNNGIIGGNWILSDSITGPAEWSIGKEREIKIYRKKSKGINY